MGLGSVWHLTMWTLLWSSDAFLVTKFPCLSPAVYDVLAVYCDMCTRFISLVCDKIRIRTTAGRLALMAAHLCHEILKTFNIDTTTDQKHVHPKVYCHNATQLRTRSQVGLWLRPVVPVDWESHDWLLCMQGESRETEKCYKEARETKGRQRQGNWQHCSKNCHHTWFLPPDSSLSLHDLQCRAPVR